MEAAPEGPLLTSFRSTGEEVTSWAAKCSSGTSRRLHLMAETDGPGNIVGRVSEYVATRPIQLQRGYLATVWYFSLGGKDALMYSLATTMFDAKEAKMSPWGNHIQHLQSECSLQTEVLKGKKKIWWVTNTQKGFGGTLRKMSFL